MTRITYRLRTEPIYLTIKIILMSHPSLHTNIPECNSSMTHNQILCRSNHPHPSLTSTLSHCIISLLQEKPATLHQPQCTKNHKLKLHTTPRDTIQPGAVGSTKALSHHQGGHPLLSHECFFAQPHARHWREAALHQERTASCSLCRGVITSPLLKEAQLPHDAPCWRLSGKSRIRLHSR